MSELPAMIEALQRLVEAESFSSDLEAVEKCAAVIDDLCWDHLGSGPQREGTNLVWRRPGDRPVVMLCHYDTVWPTGTLLGFPFSVDELGVARGPGVFDMKAGVVQCIFAIKQLQADGGVTVVFNADEEVGSPGSRFLIEREAHNARAVLVLEPAQDLDVKIARKGIASWRLDVRGLAAHAGLEPEKGLNSAVELANQVLAISALADADAGTSVNVTMLGAGTSKNVIPEAAWCSVDARVWTSDEAERLQSAMSSLEPTIPGTKLTLSGGLNRGPLEREASTALFERLRGLGYDVGGAAVGGASDGNFTAALGIPTLDGLGPVGGGAHARDEHVMLHEMEPRAEMVARLVEDLLRDG